MAEDVFQRRVNQRKLQFWRDTQAAAIPAEQVTETPRTFTLVGLTEKQVAAVRHAINAQRLRWSSATFSIKVYF